MSRIAKASKPKEKLLKEYTPVVVYFSAAFIGFLSYAIARIVLDGYPHPLHWAAMLAGGALGYSVGWAWFRWRGDII